MAVLRQLLGQTADRRLVLPSRSMLFLLQFFAALKAMAKNAALPQNLFILRASAPCLKNVLRPVAKAHRTYTL